MSVNVKEDESGFLYVHGEKIEGVGGGGFLSLPYWRLIYNQQRGECTAAFWDYIQLVSLQHIQTVFYIWAEAASATKK